MRLPCFVVAMLLFASAADGQFSKNPFPAPIAATGGVILVNFVEFAAIPYAGDEAPRMMLLVDEPGTRRLFINTMRGAIYSISCDGKTVTPYLDINAAAWEVMSNSPVTTAASRASPFIRRSRATAPGTASRREAEA